MVLLCFVTPAFAGSHLDDTLQSLQAGHPKDYNANDRLAMQAKNVLLRNCYECHGKPGAYPRIGFKGVLDYDDLIRSGKVVPGDLTSELFNEVSSGAMPPAIAQSQPSPAEINILKRWILAGAPSWKGASKSMAREMPKNDDAATQTMGDDADMIRGGDNANTTKPTDGGNRSMDEMGSQQQGPGRLAKLFYVLGNVLSGRDPDYGMKSWSGGNSGEQYTHGGENAHGGGAQGRQMAQTRAMDRTNEDPTADEVAPRPPTKPDDMTDYNGLPVDGKDMDTDTETDTDMPVTKKPHVVSATDAVCLAAQDMKRFSKKDRQYMRYFSLMHLMDMANDGGYPDTERAALKRAINSLSTASAAIINPTAVDTKKLLFRVDMRKLGWTDQAWKGLKDGNNQGGQPDNFIPYNASYSCGPNVDVSGINLSGVAYRTVEGDWFVGQALKGINYSNFLNQPNSLDELAKSMGIANYKAEAANGVAKRGGVPDSVPEAGADRILEWHGQQYVGKDGRRYYRLDKNGKPRYFWISDNFDTINNILKRSGILHNVDPNAGFLDIEAHDVMYELPNGMPAYYHTGMTGVHQDQEKTGLACMKCHTNGLRDFNDEIAGTLPARAQEFGQYKGVLDKLYPGAKAIHQLISDGAGALAGAVKNVQENNKALAMDPQVVKADGDPITAENSRLTTIKTARLAAQLGISPGELSRRVMGQQGLVDTLPQLTDPNGAADGGVVAQNLAPLLTPRQANNNGQQGGGFNNTNNTTTTNTTIYRLAGQDGYYHPYTFDPNTNTYTPYMGNYYYNGVLYSSGFQQQQQQQFFQTQVPQAGGFYSNGYYYPQQQFYYPQTFGGGGFFSRLFN